MLVAQHLIAFVTALSLAGIPPTVPATPKPDVLGIVMHAGRATLGSEAAAEGTTVYDGDRLSTGDGGFLQLQIGEALLHLSAKSCVLLHDDSSSAQRQFEAELVLGILTLSETLSASGEIFANAARIRPVSTNRGLVQVQLISQRELIVSASRGPAQIIYRDETEIIPEGKSYRVLLNDADDNTSAKQQDPKKPVRRRMALILLAAGSATAATLTMLLAHSSKRAAGGGVESPDQP